MRILLTAVSLLTVVRAIRVLSTDRGQTEDKRGYAEMYNSSLKEYEEFSLCGRFLTHQFRTQHSRQIVIAFENIYIIAATIPSSRYKEKNKEKYGNSWTYKKVFGMTDIGRANSLYFPSWPPGVWTSVCVTASKLRSFVEVNINGEIVVSTGDYEGHFQKYERNIFLMNTLDRFRPSHGAITDVNVWRRILTEEEVTDWQHCRGEPEGAVITWHTAHLNITDLNIADVDRNETCLRTGTSYVGYTLKKSFRDTLKFCENLGGKFAVSRDQQSLNEISTVLSSNLSQVTNRISRCSKLIYAGFKKISDDWVDVNTGEIMTWNNWIKGFPKENQECIIQNWSTGKIFTYNCDRAYCPRCELELTKKNFVLTGVCLESSVDSVFVMTSPSEFLGYIQTSMMYSVNSSRWEIVNTTNTSQVLAFMKEKDKNKDFPIGVNGWYFLDTNCTDPGEEFRSLNLHLEVEQPGDFCCDDGTCVDSQTVCNDFSDCDDGTDERNCTFLHVPPLMNDTEKPPIEIKNGKIQPIVLNATFHVLEIFGVNEVESTFDLHFILDIQWFHQFLTFEFLKYNQYDNFILTTLKNKIWIPNVEFSEIDKMISSSRDENDNVIVLRRGEPRLDADLDHIRANEVYTGVENPLKILIERRIRFSCSFDNIKNFPFGKQKCSLNFQLVGAANKVQTEVRKKSIEVGQYVIHTWTVSEQFNMKTGRNMTRLTMVLSRNIRSIFLETYLPTILMNMINQATNYISGEDKYSMIYTINITCMMVLASIFISVSSSLPITTKIKPVELWLIFNLAYPFVTILANVLLQVVTHRTIRHSNDN